MHERRMDRNCLVVIIVANRSAPNFLMVKRMKSWPVVDATDRDRIPKSADGYFMTKAMAGKSWLALKSVTTETRDEKKLTQSIWL